MVDSLLKIFSAVSELQELILIPEIIVYSFQMAKKRAVLVQVSN